MTPLIQVKAHGGDWRGPPSWKAGLEVPLFQTESGGPRPPSVILIEGPPSSGKTLLAEVLRAALDPHVQTGVHWNGFFGGSARPPRPMRRARGIPVGEGPEPDATPSSLEVRWGGKDVLLHAAPSPSQNQPPEPVKVRRAAPSSPGVLKTGLVMRGATPPPFSEGGLPLLGGLTALGPAHVLAKNTELVLWLAHSFLEELGLPSSKLILQQDAATRTHVFRGWGGAPLSGTTWAALSLLRTPIGVVLQRGVAPRSMRGFVIHEEPERGLPPSALPRLFEAWRAVFGPGLVWVCPTWQASVLKSSDHDVILSL
jgi:hypothetical protein